MLVVTKRIGDAIAIGPDVSVVVLGHGTGGGFKIGIVAPRSLHVRPSDLPAFLDQLPPGADLRPLVLALAERIKVQSDLLGRAAQRPGVRR